MTTSAQAPARNPNAVRGRFDWHELMTTDPEAAKRFYTAVIGWGTQDWPGSNPPYTMWTGNGTPVGGLMKLPEDAVRQGARSHWLTYIESQDVDETHAHAAQLGARTMVPPTDIPEVGRFTVLTDPQGAMFAVFTPLPSANPMTTPAMGDFSWHELMTTSESDGFAFYAALFGWRKTSAMDMGEMGTYQMFGLSEDEPMGGMYTIPPGMGAPPMWLPYVHVDNADAATERVRQHGGAIMNGPMEVPGGDRVAVCTDPQGTAFAVHSRALA